MAKERDLVFDALKLFAIFLVLWGHCIQHLTSAEATDDRIFLFIYSFHMPLFMTMVGYFSGSALGLTFRELLLNKGRQLIVPSLAVGAVCLLDGWIFGELDKSLKTVIDMPWFLKCTFVCFLVYYVCGRLCRSQSLSMLLGLLVSMMFGRFSFMWMYPCFLFGILLRRHFKWVKANSGTLALFSGVLFAGLLFFWGADFWIHRDKASVLKSLPDMTLLYDWLYHYVFRIVIGFAGTTFFITLFEWLSDKVSFPPAGRRICGWGSQTLGIYIFQTVIIEIIMVRWVRFDSVSAVVFDFAVTPLLSAGVLFLCLWLISLTKKSRWLSFLFLGLPLRGKNNKDNRGAETTVSRRG